jgi:hypothetical protein
LCCPKNRHFSWAGFNQYNLADYLWILFGEPAWTEETGKEPGR